MTTRIDLLDEDGRRALRHVPVEQLAHKVVLLTGASGLVGTHFLYGLKYCQRELRLPMEVVGVVQRQPPEHLQQLERQGYVRLARGDLAEPSFLAGLPRAHVIVHAATYGQPGMFMANPAITLKLNTTATFALLEKLLSGGVFLFLSSSEVYSGLSQAPFSETQIGDTNTTHPRSCYIEAKRCGEAICQAYRQRGGAVKAARLSLAYGPGTRQGDKRVLNTFIERAIVQGAIRLLDQGQAKRTYCYVADAMHLMWRILLEGRELLYNVGGVSRTTIADVARLIGRLLNVPVEFPKIESESLAGAPDDVYLDLTRFTSEFGPVDFLPMEEGVARTIAWYDALHKSPDRDSHR